GRGAKPSSVGIIGTTSGVDATARRQSAAHLCRCAGPDAIARRPPAYVFMPRLRPGSGGLMRTIGTAGAFALTAALLLPLPGAAPFVAAPPARAQSSDTALDARVRAFLESRRGQWRDMNVPEVDGQTLHDLIVKHKYTRALEIGTSTGHSGIWIAWALSRTGGRLITIDIDERRHRQALENFRAAGLDRYIDARLGDAHEIVPALEGP